MVQKMTETLFAKQSKSMAKRARRNTDVKSVENGSERKSRSMVLYTKFLTNANSLKMLERMWEERRTISTSHSTKIRTTTKSCGLTPSVKTVIESTRPSNVEAY